MADALYNSWFDLADVDRDGVLSGQEAVHFFLRSDLPQQTLKRVRLFLGARSAMFVGTCALFADSQPRVRPRESFSSLGDVGEESDAATCA
jgi:hypothetical protein